MGFFRNRQIKKTLRQQEKAAEEKKVSGFDRFHANKQKPKKQGAVSKAKEALANYNAGAAQRDQDATERFNRKAKLERAKKSYKKAKGGGMSGGSMFGNGKSMFGDKPLTMGGGMSGGNGYGSTMGGTLGGAIGASKPKARKPKKRRAKKRKSGKVKKVVYYN